ncbi:MAG: hypothetical protein ACTS44_00930 [Candidatus Hodgkinia cicadicola]
MNEVLKEINLIILSPEALTLRTLEAKVKPKASAVEGLLDLSKLE